MGSALKSRVRGVAVPAQRERMLSQRLAKCCLFAASPFTTATLGPKLEKVGAEWMEHERALGPEGSAPKCAAAEVAARSEHILELLEDLVAGYEAGT